MSDNIRALSNLIKKSDCPLRELPPGSTFSGKPGKITFQRASASSNQIQRLAIINCELDDLAPLASLLQLSHLDLSSNQISDLAPLASLPQLSYLELTHNQISDLAPLASLPQLSSLYLSSNQISDLAPLASLLQLSSLYLSSNQISDLAPLASLLQLFHLDLSDNQISDLAPLASLPQLYALELHNNLISEIAPLAAVPNWKRLDLSNNRIQDASPLRNLAAAINLFGNPVEMLHATWFHEPWVVFTAQDLGQAFRRLIQAREPTLILGKNPLVSPPIELIQRGDNLQAYFQQSGPLQRLSQIKILVLGAGAAGKTSLIKRLLEPENPAAFDQKEPQTHGINIFKLPLQMGDSKMTTRIWDFGGQEVMHATHKFFLSRRSLFVIVLDGRRDEDPEHWLAHAKIYGEGPPTILVLNKVDANPAYDLPLEKLKRRYPFIVDCVRTSAKTGEGLPQLLAALECHGATLPMAHMQLPQRWIQVMAQLEADPQPFLSCEAFEALCKREGLAYTNQHKVLTGFLNDLGVALHIPKIALNDTYVLNPEWATQGVYRIITHPEVEANKGFIPHDSQTLARYLKEPSYPDQKHLPEHLKHFQYPDHKHHFLLQLLEQFELCFPISEPDKGYLVPNLLPVEVPPWNKFEHHKATHLRICYKDFLPPTVFPRLMVKHYRLLNLEHCDRTTMAAQREKAQALIHSDKRNKRLHLKVAGPGTHHFLAILRESLDQIHNNMDRNLYTLEIACGCPSCKNNDDPTFHKLGELMARWLAGDRQAYCHNAYENKKIATLLGEIHQEDQLLEIKGLAEQVRSIAQDIKRNQNPPQNDYEIFRQRFDTKIGIPGFKFDWLEELNRFIKKIFNRD